MNKSGLIVSENPKYVMKIKALSPLICLYDSAQMLCYTWMKFMLGVLNQEVLCLRLKRCRNLKTSIWSLEVVHLLLYSWLIQFKLIHIPKGQHNTIAWGEVDKVDGDLFWCQGGAKLPPEAVVNGSTDGLFFLVSLGNSPFPTLNAIQHHKPTKINKLTCVYSKQIFEQCNNGIRQKAEKEYKKNYFENLVLKYNVN